MSTGRLNEAVKRNAARFPEDFMLQLKRRGNPKLEIAKCDLKLGAAGAIEFGNSVPETGKTQATESGNYRAAISRFPDPAPASDADSIVR